MRKTASHDYPIHPLIAERWSPYWFAERDIGQADLVSILEAARWASSGNNAQPWEFVVVRDKDKLRQVTEIFITGNMWYWDGRETMLPVKPLTKPPGY